MTAFRDYGWVLALYVALQIAWTLLIRTFPDLQSKGHLPDQHCRPRAGVLGI